METFFVIAHGQNQGLLFALGKVDGHPVLIWNKNFNIFYEILII